MRRSYAHDKSFNPSDYDKYCVTIANPKFLYDAPGVVDGLTVTVRAKFLAVYLKERQIDLGKCAFNTAVEIDGDDFKRRYPEYFEQKIRLKKR